MTALTFTPVRSDGLTRCAGDGCTRPGRYRVYILGHPWYSESQFATREDRALLCRGCRAEWQKTWDGCLEPEPEQVAA
jgi:hypothetical protein